MLLICKARVSINCIKIRSAHNRSAMTKDCICPHCAQAIRDNPSLKEKSLEDVLKGMDDARANRRGRKQP